MTRLPQLVLSCALAFSLVTPLLARHNQSQSQSPEKLTSPERQANPAARPQIRVATNEVLVPVTATDADGEFVLDLTQKDFHVLEDGVEQSIDRWDLGGDPLAAALVMETSTRLSAYAPVLHKMGSIFTETVMALEGEAAVVTYDSTAIVRQPFTHDHDAVEKAISEAPFEAPETNLYDAMALGVSLLKVLPPERRRIMLIVGESQDTDSTAKLGPVVRDAARANISIYVVGPSSAMADLRGGNKGVTPMKIGKVPPISASPPKSDPRGRPFYDVMTPAIWLLERGTNQLKNHELEVAAAATGGIHYGAIRDSTIRSALDRIGGELHAQYALGYKSAENPAPSFHRITVTVSRPGISIRARPGYYAAPTGN